MKSLCIVTPIRDAVVGPSHVSLMRLAIEYSRLGGRVHHATTWLSSNLALARARLVDVALRSEAERILMVDDDIVFTVEDFLALSALDIGNDVVSGVYLKKQPSAGHVGTSLENGETRGALVEVASIGLGFALFTREGLSAMQSACGEGMFEFRFDGERILGEDEVFCARWRSLGQRVWMLQTVRVGHVGPHIYT